MNLHRFPFLLPIQMAVCATPTRQLSSTSLRIDKDPVPLEYQCKPECAIFDLMALIQAQPVSTTTFGNYAQHMFQVIVASKQPAKHYSFNTNLFISHAFHEGATRGLISSGTRIQSPYYKLDVNTNFVDQGRCIFHEDVTL